MLKRTKSANKSVLEDAVDNVNTAITAAGTSVFENCWKKGYTSEIF